MVFSYYNRLHPAQKRTYRKSDEIHSVVLPNAEALHPLIPMLQEALVRDDRAAVEGLSIKLVQGIAFGLNAPLLQVKVLAVRPSATWGELHGLYVPAEGRASAVISVWMRTARRRKVVAFKSFLRTFLHEICHHLDYEVFKLDESYHTGGFYKRESSLFHQLVPANNLPSDTHSD